MMRGHKSPHRGDTMETKVLLGNWDTEEEGEQVGTLYGILISYAPRL